MGLTHLRKRAEALDEIREHGLDDEQTRNEHVSDNAPERR